MSPQRIQLSRRKGWRKPEGAIVAARPSRFGNPFTVANAIEADMADDHTDARRLVVAAFRDWVGGGALYWIGPEATASRDRLLQALPQLAGHDLGCWCSLDQPCHADVLLELANPGSAPVTSGVTGP